MQLKQQFLSIYSSGNQRIAYINPKVEGQLCVLDWNSIICRAWIQVFQEEIYVLNYFVYEATAEVLEESTIR